MAVFMWILASVVGISLLSLVGLVGLSVGKPRLKKFLMFFVAFASGSLLATALAHMAPEAVHELGERAFSLVLWGILLFFFIENFIHWHHCGKHECHIRPVGYLNLIGDGLHNLIDGVIIAAAYMTSIEVGALTTIAIALHEIPQEFGDFSVLVHSGMSVRRALAYNFLSASAAIVGAVLGYVFLGGLEGYIPFVVALAAGGFIYIATADLMPELHKERDFERLVKQVTALLAGVVLIYVATSVLHTH